MDLPLLSYNNEVDVQKKVKGSIVFVTCGKLPVCEYHAYSFL